jgi:aubergine-like protein
VCKLKKIACHLIPEFCVLTGLTDEIRADFNIMKDMANATKKEPA